jgi:hypothetical protein
MKAFAPYSDYLGRLVAARLNSNISEQDSPQIERALNGQPAARLRSLVPISRLRSEGAFFTGSRLSTWALQLWSDAIWDDAFFYDPACGAGDLLLACAQEYVRRVGLSQSTSALVHRFMGRDIHPEFVSATHARLALTLLRAGAQMDPSINLARAFSQIRVGSGVEAHEALNKATHIIVNPPFRKVKAPEACLWAGGTVNSAALFVADLIEKATPGTQILAILPDVLRSGSRYANWRRFVEQRARVADVRVYGRFDRETDVDVFVLNLAVRTSVHANADTIWLPRLSEDSETVADHFSISVGHVVDYRAKHRGPWVPFVRTGDLPPWIILREVERRRRWNGATVNPPFVALRRTSAPGDPARAPATIISGEHPVAVENHLIILKPIDAKLGACRKLIAVLRSPKTDAWLDQRIRCRHLTVGSVGELPWWSKP